MPRAATTEPADMRVLAARLGVSVEHAAYLELVRLRYEEARAGAGPGASLPLRIKAMEILMRRSSSQGRGRR